VNDRAGRRHFATTRWSIVLAAGADPVSSGAHEALATLCEAYWYPLYGFLRGRGYAAPDAEDLTQAFFQRLLEKHSIRHADPARGRFRSFLRSQCPRQRISPQARGRHPDLLAGV
jgi:DNA-directed RNA polymerase specialized sigma24 family protein